MRLGYAIFTLAGITFLGLGLQPPTPDWSVDITAASRTSTTPSTTATTGRCSSRRSRSSRSAWRSRCSPIACSRCSTDERTDDDRADGRRGDGAGARGPRPRASTTACAASGARCCAASASPSSAAAPTASSASPAAASRRPRWRRSATCRATGACARARSPWRARTCSALSGQRPAALSRRRRLDGLPEPRHALNPSIRVGKQLAEVFTARGTSERRGARALAGDAAAGADRRPGVGHGALSAPALRRHAAARRDRDGARRRPGAADPRRADDRPRRDGRGRGARPHHQAAGRVPHRRAVHQPQPRRDPQDVLARGRALRRRDGRGGRRPSRCCTTPGTRTPSACCAASRAAACARTTAGSTRSPATCRRSAPICRAACSPTAARSPRTSATPRSRRSFAGRRRPRQPLLLPRARAGAPARHGRRPRGRRRRSTARGEPLIDVDDLTKIFSQDGAQRARAGRRLGRDLARRDARPRGRVGLRQDDVRAHAARHRRARRRARVALDGRALAPTLAKRTGEDVRALQIVFQNPDSALNRRHTVRRILRRSLKQPRRHHGQGGRRAHPRAERGRAPARPRHPAAPGAALGRPEAARRDRARVRRRAAPRRLRRAHLGARRVRAGRDPQPAGRAAGRARHRLPLHLARPRRRALPLGSHRGALPRAADGARHGRGRVQRAAPSVHRGAALGGADDRRRAARADPPRGRHPERRQPAQRAACSTRAARASWARSARARSRRSSRSSRRTTCAATSPSRNCADCRSPARPDRWPATDRGAAERAPDRPRRALRGRHRPRRRAAGAGRPHRRHARPGRRARGRRSRATGQRLERVVERYERRAPAPGADREPHPQQPDGAGGHARQPRARRAARSARR